MEPFKKESFYFISKFLFKEKTLSVFCLRNRSGGGVYCLYLAPRESHILSTAKAQSGALSPPPSPLGKGMYSPLPWGEVVSGSCCPLQTCAR